jgi:hypothetical protein
MSENKSSISDAQSYVEMGEYWDSHSLVDVWDQTEPVQFEVAIRSGATYYAVDSELSRHLRDLAHRRGVSAQTLLNLWVQEKVIQSDAITPSVVE